MIDFSHDIINVQGELTFGKVGEWRFDKRSYLDAPPPRNLSLPPPGVPESVVCHQKSLILNNASLFYSYLSVILMLNYL